MQRPESTGWQPVLVGLTVTSLAHERAAPGADSSRGGHGTLRKMSGPQQTVAAAYLALLARSGVDVLFGNGGTDFAPIIEAYAETPAGPRLRAAAPQFDKCSGTAAKSHF
jgi:hypothetical protein